MTEEDRSLVHDWFQLTYASYLTLPRVILQEMPGEWQRRFVDCLNELNDTWKPDAFPNYRVQRVEGECERSCDACADGPNPQDDECRCHGECERDLPDPLSHYRHPLMVYIDSLRKEPVMTEELDNRHRELDALDTDPSTPGIQSYDPEAAARGNRFLEGLALGVGLGVIAGVFLDAVFRLVFR